VSLHRLKSVLTLLSQPPPPPARSDDSPSHLEGGATEEPHHGQGGEPTDDLPRTPITTPTPAPSASVPFDHRPTGEGEREIFELHATLWPAAPSAASVKPAVPTQDSGFYTQSGGGDGDVDNASTHPTEFEDNYGLTMEFNEAAVSSEQQWRNGLVRADASLPAYGDESSLSPSIRDCNTMGIGGAMASNTRISAGPNWEVGENFDADASEGDSVNSL